MEFSEFLAKQEEVYSRFRDTKAIRTEGTVPKLPTKNAYFVVYRHPDEIAQTIDSVSRKINETIRSWIYAAHNVHTTLSDYFPDLPDFPNQEVLDNLVLGVQESQLQKPVITYPRPSWLLYNQNTVLAAGHPSVEFVHNVNQVIKNCRGHGRELREPWGGHITVARFKEKKSPRELEALFKFMDSSLPELPDSHPISLDVGYAFVSPDGIEFNPYRSFPFNS